MVNANMVNMHANIPNLLIPVSPQAIVRHPANYSIDGFLDAFEIAHRVSDQEIDTLPVVPSLVPTTDTTMQMTVSPPCDSTAPRFFGSTIRRLAADAKELLKIREKMELAPPFFIHENSRWKINLPMWRGKELVGLQFKRRDGRIVQVECTSKNETTLILTLGHHHPDISFSVLWNMALQGVDVRPLGFNLSLSETGLRAMGRFADFEEDSLPLMAFEIARLLYAYQNNDPLNLKIDQKRQTLTKEEGEPKDRQLAALISAGSFKLTSNQTRNDPSFGSKDQTSPLLSAKYSEKNPTKVEIRLLVKDDLESSAVAFIDPDIASLIWVQDIPSHIRAVRH